jgi:hypothetical protein
VRSSLGEKRVLEREATSEDPRRHGSNGLYRLEHPKRLYLFAGMMVSVVAVVTDAVRNGQTVIGYGFNGRYAVSGLGDSFLGCSQQDTTTPMRPGTTSIPTGVSGDDDKRENPAGM